MSGFTLYLCCVFFKWTGLTMLPMDKEIWKLLRGTGTGRIRCTIPQGLSLLFLVVWGFQPLCTVRNTRSKEDQNLKDPGKSSSHSLSQWTWDLSRLSRSTQGTHNHGSHCCRFAELTNPVSPQDRRLQLEQTGEMSLSAVFLVEVKALRDSDVEGSSASAASDVCLGKNSRTEQIFHLSGLAPQ